jgi:coiled-coil domain-containing protein 55
MSTLKFNFNKPKAVIKPSLNTSKPAFNDSDDEDALPAAPKPKKQPQAITGLNEDLRTYTSQAEQTTAKMAQEALAEDPSVFDYDGVYDELKRADIQKKEIAERDRVERKVCPRVNGANSSLNIWINFWRLRKFGNGIF